MWAATECAAHAARTYHARSLEGRMNHRFVLSLLLAGMLISAPAALAQTDEPSMDTPAAATDDGTDAAVAPEEPTDTSIQGISFGNPLVITVGSLQTLILPVTNNNADPRTFTVKASYVQGDVPVSSATASVNDLAPGQMKVARLLVRDGVPATYDRLQYEVRTMRASSAARADAIAGISFDNAVINTAGVSSVDVDVRNDDSAAHSFTIQAAFFSGEDPTGVANGSVANLAPGETRRVNLLLRGTTAGADASVFNVETLAR